MGPIEDRSIPQCGDSSRRSIQLRVSTHTCSGVSGNGARPMAGVPPRRPPPFWALDREEGPNGHAASLCSKELFQRQRCKSVDSRAQWQLSKYVSAERKSSRPLSSHQTQRKAVLNGWGFRTITPPSSPVRACQSPRARKKRPVALQISVCLLTRHSPPLPLGPVPKRN